MFQLEKERFAPGHTVGKGWSLAVPTPEAGTLKITGPSVDPIPHETKSKGAQLFLCLLCSQTDSWIFRDVLRKSPFFWSTKRTY